jgi:hypothetical protein
VAFGEKSEGNNEWIRDDEIENDIDISCGGKREYFLLRCLMIVSRVVYNRREIDIA